MKSNKIFKRIKKEQIIGKGVIKCIAEKNQIVLKGILKYVKMLKKEI